MQSTTDTQGSSRVAARITLLYALLGSLWTVLAGYGVAYVVNVQELRGTAQTALGCAFVLASAIMLYTWLRRHEQAEQALLEREATLQAVIAASPDAISILDAHGRIRSVSPAIRELAGYEPEKHLGHDVLEQVHPEDRPQVQRALRATLSGELKDARVSFRYRHASGDWVVLESHGRPLYHGGGRPTGMVVISREITERAQLEAELADAKEAAEQANRAKSEFLSRMSHELRTPLNAIHGFAQILEMQELSPTQRESVEHIIKAGRLLLELINEVLDIARIETSSLAISLEPVEVGELICETLDLVRHLAQPRAVELQTATGAPNRYVLADRQRLKQVLLNLLSNAIKYNYVEGRVHVHCTTIDKEWLRIEVRDTGPGICPEKIGRLFTPFERLGWEHSEIEGTGLGLALSKGLMQAMGGEIGADSIVGQGSTFWLSLPLTQPPARRLDPSPPTIPLAWRQTEHLGTVLCIEDNLSNVRLIEYALAQCQGFEVLTAVQGQLGLELARGQHPDLILLDLHLPDMPGERVLRTLREDPATCDIPVLIISADATQGQIQRLLDAGAFAYLTKPLDIRLFVDLVDDILKRHAS